MGVEKRKVAAGAAHPAASLKLAGVFKGLPALAEHISATTYSDGSNRTPGWIMVGTRDGEYRVTAKDPDGAAQLAVQDPSLDEALAALELLLSDPNAQWQADPWLAKGAKRKRA
jgi:alcohol dehydrogenase class IV